MLHRADWASIKVIKTTCSLALYYVQDGVQYTVVEGDRRQIYWTVLRESADITDFETNFKSGATSVISLDDAISRIMKDQAMDQDVVDAINSIGVSVALAQYRPKFYTASSGFPGLNDTTDTTIVDLSFTGRLSYIMVRFDRDDVELVIEVDGQEKGRFDLTSFKGAGAFNLESSTKNAYSPVQVSDNGKQILIQWLNIAPDVVSSFKLKAKETSSFDTDVISTVIAYTEKV